MGQLETLAGIQHGCLHHRQILAVVSRNELNHRIRRGSYQPVWPGVVRLAGVADAPDTRAWAGFLRVGEPCAIAGRSAALLHEIPGVSDDRRVTVVVPLSRRGPRQPGLLVHRLSGWPGRTWTHRCGLPVTSLADTVIDLAATLPAQRTGEIIEELLWRRLSCAELESRLIRGRPGSATVRALLTRLSDGHRSGQERLVAARLRARGVPIFQSNAVLRDAHGKAVAELDFLWRALRVAVQIDGWRYHAVGTFQHDHDVPNWLTVGSDYVVLRFTGRDVEHRLDWVLDQIEAVLRRQARRLGVPYAA